MGLYRDLRELNVRRADAVILAFHAWLRGRARTYGLAHL